MNILNSVPEDLLHKILIQNYNINDIVNLRYLN